MTPTPTLSTAVADLDLLPCPFCGGTNIDPAEWSGNDGQHGPGCGDCGALADSAELWNKRAAPASDIAAAPEQQFGQEVTRLVAEIRKPCSMARRDSLVEELIELIDPQAEGASAAPGSATAGAAAVKIQQLMLRVKPRRPFNDADPDGYEESDNDWIKNNQGVLVELLELVAAQGSSPAEVSPPDGAMPEPVYSPAAYRELCSIVAPFRFDGDSFMVHTVRRLAEEAAAVRRALAFEPGADVSAGEIERTINGLYELSKRAAQPAEGSAGLTYEQIFQRGRMAAIKDYAEGSAQVAMPRELVQRVYDRLCKAQIFPLAGEVRKVMDAIPEEVRKVMDAIPEEVRKVMDAIPEVAAPERSDTPADPSALLTDDKRAAIREAVRKAFPDYAHSDRMMDQLIWNTEQACVAAASKALDAAPAGLIYQVDLENTAGADVWMDVPAVEVPTWKRKSFIVRTLARIDGAQDAAPDAGGAQPCE